MSDPQFHFHSGAWRGFFLEPHQPKRGWMHLHLQCQKGRISGEGVDYVGSWTASGQFDADVGRAHWTKTYVGKHQVHYSGGLGPHGIEGIWQINPELTGIFHVWPENFAEMNLKYPVDFD